MSATSVLAGITQETTQQELLGGIILLLSSMLEKMPRVDAADRLLVSLTEVNPTVAVAANQTLATVTTVSTLSNISSLGNRDAGSLPFNMTNAGTMHIYNNIVVTA